MVTGTKPNYKSMAEKTKSGRNRAEGLILGLACGDALGRPVEFNSAGRINREHGQLTEMVSGGTHNKPAGTVTDDTELAVCIAQSLVDQGDFLPADIADKFVRWYDSNPFDMGTMTAETLRELKRGGKWDVTGRSVWSSRPEGKNAGNGSIMRCAPYALAFTDDYSKLQEVSRTSSKITHADPRCSYGCAILNLTLAGLLAQESRPLSSALEELPENVPEELLTALQPIQDGIKPETLQSSGYVIHTLQSGLYHGLTAETPREGIVNSINMGHDTDTVGAVTGAVIGARFGADALPSDWVETLTVDVESRQLPDWWLSSDTTANELRALASHLYRL